jgi:hypothetical protein
MAIPSRPLILVGRLTTLLTTEELPPPLAYNIPQQYTSWAVLMAQACVSPNSICVNVPHGLLPGAGVAERVSVCEAVLVRVLVAVRVLVLVAVLVFVAVLVRVLVLVAVLVFVAVRVLVRVLVLVADGAQPDPTIVGILRFTRSQIPS